MLRFWEKVDSSQYGPAGCWLWRAGKTAGKRYGVFKLRGKARRSHRLSYEWTYREIPSGFSVCHRCDNPLCVNPAHLWVGTQNDNVQDMISKGRYRGVTGEMNPRSKLTRQDVNDIRNARSKGVILKTLAAEYGVSVSAISTAARGVNWS